MRRVHGRLDTLRHEVLVHQRQVLPAEAAITTSSRLSCTGIVYASPPAPCHSEPDEGVQRVQEPRHLPELLFVEAAHRVALALRARGEYAEHPTLSSNIQYLQK